MRYSIEIAISNQNLNFRDKSDKMLDCLHHGFGQNIYNALNCVNALIGCVNLEIWRHLEVGRESYRSAYRLYGKQWILHVVSCVRTTSKKTLCHVFLTKQF